MPRYRQRRTRAFTLAAVVVAVAVVPSSADARSERARPIATYCSSSGDLCFGIFNRDGAVYLELTTFARYFSRYRLCVDPPRGVTTCRSFPIRRVGRLYASRVRWYRNFPARGPGAYRVTWRLGRTALGRTLTFRLPL